MPVQSSQFLYVAWCSIWWDELNPDSKTSWPGKAEISGIFWDMRFWEIALKMADVAGNGCNSEDARHECNTQDLNPFPDWGIPQSGLSAAPRLGRPK